MLRWLEDGGGNFVVHAQEYGAGVCIYEKVDVLEDLRRPFSRVYHEVHGTLEIGRPS